MVEQKTSSKSPAPALRSATKTASTKGLDIIIMGVILSIFFLLPIFFSGLAAQGIGFEKMTLFYFLTLLGIVAWVTKGVILGELNLKRTPLDLPILGILVVFIISTFLSVSGKDSLLGSYGASAKGLVALIVFILFYYLLINNITKERIKSIFWAIVSASGLLVFYSL